MKHFAVLCVLLSALTILPAFSLIDGVRTIQLTPDSLKTLPQTQIATTREKNGETKQNQWIGPTLESVLNRYRVSGFGELRFVSKDNYLVLLKPEDLAGAILALKRDNQALSEEQIRLVIPSKRDMYWIQGIDCVVAESALRPPQPGKLILARQLLAQQALKSELPPFVGVQGWHFRDLVRDPVSSADGHWFLWGRDGVSHVLDYQTYLSVAELISNGETIDLQSPAMPGGMWLKDIAAVQKDETLIIFENRFQTPSEVMSFLGWSDLPKVIYSLPAREEVKQLPPFSDSWWKTIYGVTW